MRVAADLRRDAGEAAGAAHAAPVRTGMEIRVASQAGACYGVERALRMVEQASGGAADADGAPAPEAATGAAGDGAPRVRTLGPLIHNPQVVERLARAGVVALERPEQFAAGEVAVIRSHGVAPAVVEELRARGCEVVDATCPHVKKAHEGARLLAEQGYQVLIVGEAGHPEVEGIMGNAGPDALVVDGPTALEGVRLGPRVGVVVQTTQSAALLREVVDALVGRVREVRVLNTICSATTKRQQAAATLARQADVMVVIGGKNSGNTTRLAQVCAQACPATHHVEAADELDPAWFAGARLVGVTAGASTPSDQIASVCAALEALPGAWRA